MGAPRIHGELLELGIDVAERTVSRLLPKRHSPPSQTWRTLLTNHVRDLVSVDFFTVPTARLRVLFVFVVLAHDRRRVLHFNVTEHRTTAWTTQQIGDAFPDDSAPSYLLRDRDSVYGHVFRQRLKCMRVRSLCQDEAPDCLPRLASVVAANAVCGAVIGFCVPTWYRMPQTMTVDYRGWNIRIAARTGDAGRVWTTTRIAAPTATAIGTTLVSKNGHLMAEEAIADAMDQARRFIGRAHDDA